MNDGLDSRLDVISSPEFAHHAPDAYPETASRLFWALEGVALAGVAACDVSHPAQPSWDGIHIPDRPLELAQLERVHTRAYLKYLADYAAAGGGMLSVDTEVTQDSFRVAALASTAVWLGVEQAITTGKPSLALVRPPGHHAGPASGMGFCLINHAAVAARLFQALSGHGRVAIIDWDVHHGNGTAAVFAADPDCLYVSMHESPLYPYTGWYSEAGAGPGAGTTVNLPLPGALTDDQVVEAFRRVVLPCVEQYRPALILVSAGLDGHWLDKMSSWQLTANGYHRLANLVRGVAQGGTGVPLVALLEGGYSPVGMRLGVAATAAGLAGIDPAAEVLADVLSDVPQQGGARQRQAKAFAMRLDEIVAFQRRYWDLA